MVSIPLSVRQFNDLVAFLKRLDDIGDAFFLVGDVICPCVRCKENFPGLHFVRNAIPMEQRPDIIYGIAHLSETSKALGDVRGKKTIIQIDQSESGIWITVNDLRLKLAGKYDKDQLEADDVPVPNGSFDALLDMANWVEIPQDTLNSIKDGKVAIFEDSRGTTFVRLGKDLFKLRGATRVGVPVKYTAELCIISPVGDKNTLTVNFGSDDNGTVIIHVTESVIEALHFYKFNPFHYE